MMRFGLFEMCLLATKKRLGFESKTLPVEAKVLAK